MRYTAAYLLAILDGNSSPDVAAIAKILGSVGIECNENRAQQVIDACKGQDVNKIIASGLVKVDNALANTSGGMTQTIPQDIPVPSKDKKGTPVEQDPPTRQDNSPDSPTGSENFGDLFGD